MTATLTHIRPWIPELTLADRLRIVRRDYGRKLGRTKTLTVKEFALMLGIPAGTYGLWEANGRPADVVEACKKVHALTGCDPVWLAGFDQPTAPTDPGTGADLPGREFGWTHGLAEVRSIRAA